MVRKSRKSRRKVNKKSRKKQKAKKLNKNINSAICSPIRKDKKNYSCYDDESLDKIKNLWNIRHPDHKIRATSDKEIWDELRKNMGNVCNNEKCWLRQNFAKNKLTSKLLNYTFAPNSPSSWKKNPTEWLTSLDIEKVMKQYENKYNYFNFVGPSPIDFDTHIHHNECVWEELCKFNLEKQSGKGKRKFGIIFNIDPHYKEGSHWVSMFIDLDKKFIMYFDSTGEKIPKEIKNLMNKIIKQAANMGITLKSYINKKGHQRKDTECGMYSLYFIIELLEDKKKPEYFLSHRISDAEMEELRKQYFNESDV